jgi:hypothetical protein
MKVLGENVRARERLLTYVKRANGDSAGPASWSKPHTCAGLPALLNELRETPLALSSLRVAGHAR